MAFIYEVNGQRVEFEKEPTEKDIDEAARALAPAPKSQQPNPVEGGGGAAFGVYRPQGRRPESQQGREASKDMPLQTARGVVTGTLGAIPDLLNLPGTIYSGLSGNEAPYKVPLGSEEWNQMLPFQSDTPQSRLARFGGEVLAPIPTIKGAKAIARAPGQVYRAGQEFKQGAMEGLRNPVYNPTSPTRSFDPLQETYYPTPQVQAFQNAPVMDRPGMLSQLEASQQPSSSLFNSPTELLATALGPKTAQGQNLIPYQGQTTKAFGETVGRDIATEPYKRAGLPSLAGATIGGLAGGPFGAILGLGAGAALNPLLRGAELFALNKLGKTAGFSKGFPEQLAEAQQLAGRTGLEASIPQTPLLTGPSGPVAPTRTMYVNPEGVATTNVQGTQTNYTPGGRVTPNFATIRNQNKTAAQQSQQLAAQKLQEIQAKQQPQQVLSPEQQQKGNDILAQIRARNAAGGSNQPGQMISRPPTQGPLAQVETPVAGPVNPSSIEASIDALPSERWTLAEKLALERAKLQETPPTVMSAADEADMAKQAIESQKATNSEIISQHAKGNIMGETTSIDTGKNAYNGSNSTQGKAKALEKAGVDSLPIVNGMTDAQVIDALHTEMFGKKTKSPFTPEARTSKTINSELNALEEQMTSLRDDALESRLKPDTPEGEAYSKQLNELSKQATALEKELEIVKKAEKKASKSAPKTLEEKVDIVKSQGEARRNQARGKPDVLGMQIGEAPAGKSVLDQSIVAKRSFNEDMERYRYGSPKDPLTLEEYNYLKNSDFIEKQNMFDILKERDPAYIEHTFWYKDKDGVVTNMQAYKGDLSITKVDKNNPEKEISYSKSNPDREDEWTFYKIEHIGGNRKILEKFTVKDTFAPRDPRLKNWPEEFTNSKYDLE
jgi:hypothetical protein